MSAPASETVAATLVVNGTTHQLTLDPRSTILDALRDVLGVTSAKKGCDHGQCGACTVLADGRRIVSCLALAASYDGVSVSTSEAFGDVSSLSALQQAFVDRDALQCGYCTPGQVCSTMGMFEEARRCVPSAASADVSMSDFDLDDVEIRERMSGNLCRCGAYVNIVAAIADAAAAEGLRR